MIAHLKRTWDRLLRVFNLEEHQQNMREWKESDQTWTGHTNPDKVTEHMLHLLIDILGLFFNAIILIGHFFVVDLSKATQPNEMAKITSKEIRADRESSCLSYWFQMTGTGQPNLEVSTDFHGKLRSHHGSK